MRHSAIRPIHISTLICLSIMTFTAAAPLLAQTNSGKGNGSSGYDLGLIEAEELSQRPDGWRILDARPKAQWSKRHIRGSISFSWEDYTRTDEQGIDYRIWPPKKLAQALGAMGIDRSTPIVVYGDADKSWGGEGWVCWILTWLGHEGPIRLLAGGIQSWENHGYPLSSIDESKVAPSKEYLLRLRNEVLITTTEIRKLKGEITLVDTRSFLEWMRGGIPNATRIGWENFFTGKDRRPLSPYETQKLLRNNGIDSSKRVVYYCTGGIRSAYAWLIHQLAGLPVASNYEGGMEAWIKDAKD